MNKKRKLLDKLYVLFEKANCNCEKEKYAKYIGLIEGVKK